jgi:hypothetical protein
VSITSVAEEELIGGFPGYDSLQEALLSTNELQKACSGIDESRKTVGGGPSSLSSGSQWAIRVMI